MSASKIKRREPIPESVVGEFFVPSSGSELRKSLEQCAAEGDAFAEELLETIRKLEDGQALDQDEAYSYEEFIRSRIRKTQ